MALLVGIDLGTSSLKVIVMNEYGIIVTDRSKEYVIETPKATFSEQNPVTWWDAAVYCLRATSKAIGSQVNDICAIGLSGQMHGLVILDKNMKLLKPAIIHCDRRSELQINKIYELIGKDELTAITGNELFPGFLLASLIWVKENEPQIFNRIHKLMLPKDYLRYRLTGLVATESTDASGTLAFDIYKKKWADKIIDKLDIPKSIFPEVFNSFEVAGTLTEDAAMICGLKKGTPVVYGGADQPMQALGNGVISQGQVTATIGTSGQLFSPVLSPLKDPKLRVHTFCNAVPNTWYTLGAMMSAGLSLTWLNKNVLEDKELSVIVKYAGEIPVGSEGLIFLPYLIGERTPHLNSKAKSMFFGITINHTKNHMIRAVMEGVVFGLRDSLEILKEIGINIDHIIASGGGAISQLWLQMLADIFGMEITRTNIREQAAVGAAIAAGIGCEVYLDVIAACETLKSNERFEDSKLQKVIPITRNVEIYNKTYETYKKLYKNNVNLFS